MAKRTTTEVIAEPGTAEFGPRAVRMVPHRAIVPFRQIRGDIAAEPLEELKRSIRTIDDDGETQYNLVNAVVVAELDDNHAQAYLDDLNAFWGTQYALDEQPFDPETGHYMFLVAGHRRWTGVGQIIKEDGLNPLTTRIAVSAQHNINFAQAIVLQMQENTYERPTPTDQAEAIRLAYDFFKQRDARLSKAGFARMIGRSADVVSDALTYSELPDALKSWVRDKDISYTLAVMLGKIRGEYVKRYPRIVADGLLADDDKFASAEDYADYEVMTVAFTLRAIIQRNSRLTAAATERAKEKLALMRNEGKYVQDAFELVIQQESATRRRLKAVRGLGEASIKSLRAALREDPDLLAALLHADIDTVTMLLQGLERAQQGPPRTAEQAALLN